MFQRIKRIQFNQQVIPIRNCLVLKYCPQHQITFDVWDRNHFNPDDLLILEARRDAIFGDQLRVYPNQYEDGFALLNGNPLIMGRIEVMELENKLVVGRPDGALQDINLTVCTDYFPWVKITAIAGMIGLMLALIWFIVFTHRFNNQLNASRDLFETKHIQEAYSILDGASTYKSRSLLGGILNGDEKLRRHLNSHYIKGLYQLAQKNVHSRGTPLAFLPMPTYNPDSLLLRFLYQHPFALDSAASILFHQKKSGGGSGIDKIKRLEARCQLDLVMNMKCDSCDLKWLVKNTRTRFEFYRELVMLKYQIEIGTDVGSDTRKMATIIENALENEIPDVFSHRSEFIQLLQAMYNRWPRKKPHEKLLTVSIKLQNHQN